MIKIFCFQRKINNTYFQIVENNQIAFLERVYRDDIVFLLAIFNSEYCKAEDAVGSRQIECYNLEGNLIATFKNQRLLIKLMPHIPASTIVNQLLYSKGIKRFNKYGLTFKYKE